MPPDAIVLLSPEIAIAIFTSAVVIVLNFINVGVVAVCAVIGTLVALLKP